MYLTHDEFLKRVKELNSNYWREGADYRWEYMEYAITELQRLNAKNIIEAGAFRMPLCDNSFMFDFPNHNLDRIPYNFKDKEFDIFVALQTWEHLDRQTEAFQEVMRISKNAILSFPYRWRHGDQRHRGIDSKRISMWTCGVEPARMKLIKDRIVYTWEFK